MADEQKDGMIRVTFYMDADDRNFFEELAFAERKETPKPTVSEYIRRAVKRFRKMKEGTAVASAQPKKVEKKGGKK